jgi:hypothetical protein
MSNVSCPQCGNNWSVTLQRGGKAACPRCKSKVSLSVGTSIPSWTTGRDLPKANSDLSSEFSSIVSAFLAIAVTVIIVFGAFYIGGNLPSLSAFYTNNAAQNSSITLEQTVRKHYDTSSGNRVAHVERMVANGASREDAEAFTKSVYDAQEEFQNSNR